ncbi:MULTISPECIES: WD40 repeat domain-containing protein [Bacillus]|uniref:WD40 repeat domain-containing protein n=1 Tax=Bacillus TaxID=1386 RepID=UPI0011A656A9|nr:MULTISPECIES: WD40 repeat domain-containing protein [Bacillus]MDI0274940.1 WD40 repeat domain-containing protein [Bacillus safensis]QRY35831.1 WD40 repeat domain-containing protein [Bacillus sp. PDNC022]UQZ92073.1 WD40 repeat domain-containing protein [Bacillus safensis]UXO88965.1 WD40 repeat domain-containing protein [Bacillus safensis]WAT81489.1 WD40 repeat domain-containing protein [Bacillus safensis]
MHRGPITSVLSTQHDQIVYTGGYDRCIYQWNRATGEGTFIGSHEHIINSLSLSENGKYLASASSDYTIQLYDTGTHTRIRTLFGHADDVEAVAFAKQDTLLVSVSRDRRCLVWDIETGAILREFHGHSKDVLAVWIHGDKAYTTGDDGYVLVWLYETGEIVGEIGPFDYELDTISGSNQKEVFALGRDDGTVIIYDAATLQEKKIIKAHLQGVKRVNFSPSGNYLLTAGYDHLIKLWNYETGDLVDTLLPHKYQWERSLVWTEDEKSILGASFGKTYCEWSIEKGKVISDEIEMATPSINDIALTDAGDIITASDDGKFRKNGIEIAKSTGVLTNGVAVARDGSYYAWGDHASQVHIVHESLQQMVSFDLNTGPVNSVYFHEEDRQFYIGTYGGYVHVISTEHLKEIGRSKAHDCAVKALKVEGDHIITAAVEGTICLLDKKSLSLKAEYIGATELLNDVFIDSKRDRIAIVSRDKNVRLFDLHTGRILDQHNEHQYSIKSVTVTDSGYIVSGDYWGYIVVWNPELNVNTGPIRIAQNGISAIRQLGNDVYASSYDGGIYHVREDGTHTEVLRLFEQFPKEVISH